jgi:hypothetical protein
MMNFEDIEDRDGTRTAGFSEERTTNIQPQASDCHSTFGHLLALKRPGPLSQFLPCTPPSSTEKTFLQFFTTQLHANLHVEPF